ASSPSRSVITNACSNPWPAFPAPERRSVFPGPDGAPPCVHSLERGSAPWNDRRAEAIRSRMCTETQSQDRGSVGRCQPRLERGPWGINPLRGAGSGFNDALPKRGARLGGPAPGGIEVRQNREDSKYPIDRKTNRA